MPARKSSDNSRRRPRRTFADLEADILSRLGEPGIIEAYASFGVNFLHEAPRSNGKIECFAIDRDERSPSAYVDIATGRYGDSGSTDKEITLWEFAFRHGNGRHASWQAARQHYANVVGVELPGGRGGRSGSARGSDRNNSSAGLNGHATTTRKSARERSPRRPAEDWRAALTFQEWDDGNRRLAHLWCSVRKPGTSVEAVIAAGGRVAKYRNDAKVIGVPVLSPANLSGEPIGWIIWNITGGEFRLSAEVTAKMKTVGSADGWIIAQPADELATAAIVVKLEGPTDLLAASAARLRESAESVDSPSTPPPASPATFLLSFAGGAKQAHTSLAAPLAGRTVYIVGDSDEAGQAGAKKSGAVIAAAGLGTSVLLAPPQYEVVAKHGRDFRDWLNDGGTFGGFLAGMTFDGIPVFAGDPAAGTNTTDVEADSPASNDGQPSLSDTSDDLAPIEADDDPHRLARSFIEHYSSELTPQPDGTTARRSTLRYWREEWHQWRGREYREIKERELKGLLSESIKQEFDTINLAEQSESDRAGEAKKVSRSLVADVLSALCGMSLLPFDREAPFWISGAGPWPASEVFATGSGLIHLPSLVDGSLQHKLPSTPDFFSPNSVHYRFPEDDPTKCPPPDEWFKFLRGIWPDDDQSAALLQEWFGYCLTGDTSQQKIMLLVGPPRSGKGTIARIMSALVGPSNVVNPKLSQFEKEYGLAPLIGKTVAIIGDARLSNRSNTAEIIETLLSISGEDPQTVARKYISHVTTRLQTRFTLISNDIPALPDASGAFSSRCLLLQTKESFLGKEDKTLEAKLMAELPGILIWAIQGWARLREAGRFTQPESSRSAIEKLEALTSPVKAFLYEHCELGPTFECPVACLYEAYCGWCKEQGMKPKPRNYFSRDLSSIIPGLETPQRREGDDRVRVFTGVKLLPNH